MTSLRPATPADAAAMAAIQAAAMEMRAGDHYTDEQLAHLAPADPGADDIPEVEFTSDACRPVVAERDDRIVGWGSVHLDPGVVAATFVDPDHAREGVGRRVVEQLEAEARAAGLDSLAVQASLNAVGFYECLGFERRGEVDAGGPEAPVIPAVELVKSLD